MGKKTLGDRMIDLTSGMSVLSERVSNLIIKNNKSNAEVIDKIDDLCEKVNHQHTNHENRIQDLEKNSLMQNSKYKARMELFRWTTALLSVVLTAVGILKGLGII